MSAPLFSPLFFIGQVQPDGLQFDAWTDRPLLQSLEAGGADWPSSCRNGTCRTCLGTLVSGEVSYSVAWPGLSAEEKAEGCVLPCVAHPLSDVVLRSPGP
jgi:ferredoxin